MTYSGSPDLDATINKAIGETLLDIMPAFPFEFGIATPPLPRKLVRDLAQK